MVIFGLLIHVGDAAAGERAMAPFRALATPLGDMLRPMPYEQIYPPEDGSYHPLAVSHNMFLERFDRSTAETALDFLARSDAPMRALQLRILGGAIARVPEDATAYAHRTKPIMVNIAAFHDGSPEDIARRTAWMQDFARAIDQGVPGAYVNFIGDEGEARVHAAYPDATWQRLAEIKRRYDPTNLFHRNQNVPPAR
jgi:FAD/FMN-containing dehydrogenase